MADELMIAELCRRSLNLTGEKSFLLLLANKCFLNSRKNIACVYDSNRPIYCRQYLCNCGNEKWCCTQHQDPLLKNIRYSHYLKVWLMGMLYECCRLTFKISHLEIKEFPNYTELLSVHVVRHQMTVVYFSFKYLRDKFWSLESSMGA